MQCYLACRQLCQSPVAQTLLIFTHMFRTAARLWHSWRSFCTTLLRTAPLSVEDWAALNTAFPSSLSIAKLGLYTGSAVVATLEMLQWGHTADLKKKLEEKIEAQTRSLKAEIQAEMRAAVQGEITSKLDSIEAQLLRMQQQLQQPGQVPKGTGSE